MSISYIFYEIFSMKYEFLGLYDKDLDLLISLISFWWFCLEFWNFFLIKKDIFFWQR